MLSVINVLPHGGSQWCLAVLSNYKMARVPAYPAPVKRQTVYQDCEIVRIQEPLPDQPEYIHISLVKKPRAKKRAAKSDFIRDLSKYDAAEELEWIKQSIVKVAPEVMGRFKASDTLDDLAMDCYLYFWDRQLYRRCPKEVPYRVYLQVAVKNRLIDLQRSKANQAVERSQSMNKTVIDSEGNTVEFQDLIVDRDAISLADQMERAELHRAYSAAVIDLDARFPTGLSHLSYKRLFDLLLSGESVLDIHARTKYAKRTIQFCIDKLRSELKKVAN